MKGYQKSHMLKKKKASLSQSILWTKQSRAQRESPQNGDSGATGFRKSAAVTKIRFVWISTPVMLNILISSGFWKLSSF